MLLYLAALVLSAHSLCRSFARASPSLSCCQNASVARSLRSSTRGGLRRSFLHISSSVGDIPVIVCGVTLYSVLKQKVPEDLPPVSCFESGNPHNFQKGFIATFHFSIALQPVRYTLLVLNSQIFQEGFKLFRCEWGSIIATDCFW